MTGRLEGMRVVNTRALAQARELDHALITAGATPVSFPCIEIVPPVDRKALDDAVARCLAGHFDWIVLTSVNSVLALRERMDRIPAGTRIAAVGQSTAAALAREFSHDDTFLPEGHYSLELGSSTPIEPEESVFIPSSEIASLDLDRQLEQRGANVTRVVAYRTVTGTGGVDLRARLTDGTIDALTFSSPSAVRGLIARFREVGHGAWEHFSLPAACIGATTATAARETGFTLTVASFHQSVSGLIDALARTRSSIARGESTWQ
jgi:uroporphyrinogen-III synthase